MPTKEAFLCSDHTLVHLLDPQAPLPMRSLLLREDVGVVRFCKAFVDLEVVFVAQHETQRSVAPSLGKQARLVEGDEERYGIGPN